jgi:branched-chain amino acid transport system substrate-binding protein
MKHAAVALGVWMACAFGGLPAAAQISGGAVRIGVLTDMSGPYADIGGVGSVEAARLAVGTFGGRVAGVPVEVVAADHQLKADIASTIVREWFDTKGVDAVFDLIGSNVALAVREITRQKKKVDVSSGSGAIALIDRSCSPTGMLWSWDTYSVPKANIIAAMDQGAKTWFLLSADYVFGHEVEAIAARTIEERGGRIVGRMRHPLNATDFSASLLQAAQSGAQAIAVGNVGQDFINTQRQAVEFQLPQQGVRIVGVLANFNDYQAIGLDLAQGMTASESFYWDLDDNTRAFSRRFEARAGFKPSDIHAGVYSSVLHYLKAVEAARSDDGPTVAAKMRELPVEDETVAHGRIREDGRLLRDMFFFRVKTPAESRGRSDVYALVGRAPADEVTRPMRAGGCVVSRLSGP